MRVDRHSNEDGNAPARANLRRVGPALVVLLVVPLVWLAPALRPGFVLSSADMLLGSYLLNEARPPGHEASNVLIGDTVMQMLPWRQVERDELWHGRMPFWNPHAFAGAPLLGNAQSGLFDPLAFPYLLTGEAVRASVWVMLLRLWVAGLGAWLLAVRLGASPGAAVVAGLIYQVGGFTLVWLMYPLVASSVWFPWAFLAAEVLAVKGGGLRIVALALVLSAVTFGGHLEVAFFAALAVAAYVVLRRIQERGLSWRTVSRAAAAVGGTALLTLLLTAPQTFPFLEALSQGMLLHGRQAAAAVRGARLDWFVLALFPFLFGRPLAGEVNLAGVATNYCEQSGAYASALGLALALLAVAACKRRSPWAAVVVVGATAWAFAASLPPLAHLGRAIPVLAVAPPGRAVFVAFLALALLAARGVDVVAADDRGGARRALGWSLVTLATFSAVHGLWLVTGAPNAEGLLAWVGRLPSFHRWFAGVEPRLLQSFGTLAPRLAWDYVMPWTVAVIAAAFVVLAGRRLGRFLVPSALAVVAFDLALFGWGFNPAIPASQAYPRTRRLAELREVAGDGRILVLNWGLYANVASYYGLDDVNGYDAIGRRRLTELMRAACRFPPGPVHWPIAQFDCYDSPVIDVLDVRAVASARPVESGGLDLVSQTRSGGYLYRNGRAMTRAWIPAEVVSVRGRAAAVGVVRARTDSLRRSAVVEVSDGTAIRAGRGRTVARRAAPGRIVIDATMHEGGIVVISEAWDPGWRATSEGAALAVLPADVALMAVQVPAGTHQVELRYRPRYWLAAVALWLAGLLCVAAVTLKHLAARGRPFP